MTRKKPDNAHRFTYCDDCGKRGYLTRKAARAGKRLLHAHDSRVQVYRCPHRELWHIGHAPENVQRGYVPRSVLPSGQPVAPSRRSNSE